MPPSPSLNVRLHQASRLRHLQLTSVTVPWTETPTSSLTLLHLTNIEDVALSADMLLAILEASPQLRDLALSSVNYWHFSPSLISNPSNKQISLTHLQHLTIFDVLMDILHALTVHTLLPSRRCSIYLLLATAHRGT